MTKEFNCVSQYKNILEENIMKENLKKMISYYKPYKRVFFADTFCNYSIYSSSDNTFGS